MVARKPSEYCSTSQAKPKPVRVLPVWLVVQYSKVAKPVPVGLPLLAATFAPIAVSVPTPLASKPYTAFDAPSVLVLLYKPDCGKELVIVQPVGTVAALPA